MNVLVTGATGLVGNAVAQGLVQAGHEVRAMVHHKPCELPGVSTVQADLIAGEDLASAIEGCEIVVHAAGTMDLPEDEMRAFHVRGSAALAEAAVRVGVKRFVLVSSAAVYEPGEMHEAREDHSTELSPIYGRVKLQGEQAVAAAVSGHSCALVMLRPSSVYTSGPCPILERAVGLVQAPELPLVKEGNVPIELVHAHDLADAVRLVLRNPEQTGAFNISGPERPRFRELIDFVGELLGATPRWRPAEERDDWDPVVLAMAGNTRTLNLDKARQRLGYAPSRDWREEILAAARKFGG